MLRSFLFVMLGLLVSYNSMAMPAEDPTTWTYEVKSKGNHEYELVFHVNLQKPWHIWSMTPGGDGFLIPPSFSFNKTEGVQFEGATTEHGNKITETQEGIDGEVHYFAGEVSYKQTVKVKGSCKITGTHEYQVCNESMCLPPKKNAFSFEIKE